MRKLRHIGSLLAVFLVVAQAPALEQVDLDGLGWLGNRHMEERLGFLIGEHRDEGSFLDAALLEDSAYLLLEQMERQGYLRPTVRGEFRSRGELVSAEWGTPYHVQLPVEFRAESARYTIEPGLLYYYQSVTVQGLDGIELENPVRFFIPGGTWITRKKDFAFTPENFERRKNRLLARLEAMGYADARVTSKQVEPDDSTGAVQLNLSVAPGLLHRVGTVRLESEGIWPEEIEVVVLEEGAIFSRDWLRDARVKLLQAAYAAGYPDAEIRHDLPEASAGSEGELRQSVRFNLRPGPQVQLAGVRFEGDLKTKASVLKRQADLQTGAPFDPTQVDRARRRLMGLGIYRQVQQHEQPESGDLREVVYQLTPGVQQELQLLGGWGSYEQARVGFRWRHKNPWGRAHRYNARVKQSFKATRLQSSYHVPQLFGSNLESYSEIEYSTRDEISYERTRRGVSSGVSALLGSSGWRMAVEYSWFAEEADGVEADGLSVETDALVASVGLSLTLDRRNDPLAPSSGYDLFAHFKSANQALGGNVDFQRIQFGGSYHFSLSQRTILHVGLRAGILQGAEGDLPFGERFFSGGENTIRGYKEGEASPLNRNGDPIGAEAFWLGNVELEERVLRDLSLVGFFDIAGVSRDGGFKGGSEILPSIGIGLRYQTVVGPVRLEYGHNLNPRQADRDGHLHFSIGYPF